MGGRNEECKSVSNGAFLVLVLLEILGFCLDWKTSCQRYCQKSRKQIRSKSSPSPKNPQKDPFILQVMPPRCE